MVDIKGGGKAAIESPIINDTGHPSNTVIKIHIENGMHVLPMVITCCHRYIVALA